MRQLRPAARAFTLVEITVVVAVIGIAASLGMMMLSQAIKTAQQRDSAYRFVEDTRRMRADNIRQGLYTIMSAAPATGGTFITFGGQRSGSVGETPCQAFLSRSLPPDVVVTKFYRELDIVLSTDGASPAPLTNVCFTPGGQPYSEDLSTPIPIKADIANAGGGGGAPQQMVVDGNGGMESTFDTQVQDGVANNSLYPYNDLGDLTPKPLTRFPPEPTGPTYPDYQTGLPIDPNGSCGGAAAAGPTGCGAAAAGPAAGCGASCGASCGAAACGAASCGAAAGPTGCGASCGASCGAAAGPTGCGASCGASCGAASCGAASCGASCGAASCGAASCGASCGGSCGGCGGGCGCGGCFVAGTKVATAAGERAIEEVQVGDDVLAYDTGAGERGVFPVAAVFTRTVDELVILDVGGESIETTREHPFWVDGTGFTKAGDLVVGDMLVGLSGERRPVEGVHRLLGTFQVHNFHVEGAHTYFVTDMNLLVHNMSMYPY